MPRRTATASSSASPSGYKRLWKSLSDHAIAPAVKSHLRKRASGSRHRVGGGFGNHEFVHDWMRPMSEIVESRRQNGRKRLSARRRRMKSASAKKRRGGFVRGGSVQHFPQESGAVCAEPPVVTQGV